MDWWCLWNGDGVAVIAYIGTVWLSGLDSAPIQVLSLWRGEDAGAAGVLVPLVVVP